MNEPNTKPYQLPANAVWFITGCSSGVGQSLAQLINKYASLRLVATARSIDSLSAIADSPNVLKLQLDITSQPAINTAITTALERFGRIDVLVNNAGHGLIGEAEATTNVQARNVFETDFWGTVNLTLKALKVMREENEKTGSAGGVIMNITSVGGFIGLPGNSFYNASKFGVEGFTEAVSRELRPEWNIHLCLIEPGGIATGFAGSRLVQTAQHPAYTAPDSPSSILRSYILNPENQKTWATPQSIAEAIYQVAARGQRIPLRVPLGADTWKMMKDEIEKIGQDLEYIKDISLNILSAGNTNSIEYIG